MSKLESWFGLSYAGWITIPRSLTKQMSKDWQDRMGELLEEYENTFPNQPDVETRVMFVKRGKFTSDFNWLHNYRYPKINLINKMRIYE